MILKKDFLKMAILIIFSYILIIIDTKYFYVNTYYKKDIINYNKEIVLEIPKIKLYQKVIDKGNNYSNLNYNLVYYNNTDINNKIIIFGHSGMGRGTYFNRIDELNINDDIYFYNKYKVNYKVIKKYIIKENNLDILNNDNNNLLLVTCFKKDNKKRVVIEAKKY